MEIKYQLEIYYQCEVIDRKEFDSPIIIPNVGDGFNLMEWENDNMAQGYEWWIVQEVKHIFWKSVKGYYVQKILIDIKPDKNNGLFKSDPLYENE
ncbi:MAG: hypothetical protein ACO1O6_08235 [Bacteroidota bacterium]